jgi:hypothetical protein
VHWGLRLTVVSLEDEPRVVGGSTTGNRRGAQVALVLFVVAVVAALPLYLWRGREQWFYLDEWDYLADRNAMSPHDLVRPHNEHWQTLPILIYRLLWRVFGLHSYKPYQLMTIGLHLTAACLLRVAMRRAGVGGWIATAAASLFVLFGAGHENIIWAFQIGFVLSLVCGLAHLMLADHDGRLDHRDALGLAFGIAGLMSSGFGVTMSVVVGLAVLIRRGWRPAAFHVVPLAASFVAWWLAIGRGAYSGSPGSVRSITEFVAVGVSNAFVQLGQQPGTGIALGVLLVGGLVLAWRDVPFELFRKRAAVPVGLLAGGVVFLFNTAMIRDDAAIAINLGIIKQASDGARAGRYVYLLAAMTLPALAFAAGAIAKRWRMLTPVVVAAFLIGVPGNVSAIEPSGVERFRLGQPELVLALPRSPYARQLPRSSRPLGMGGPYVTMGWLLDGVASGRIPEPDVTLSRQATTSLWIALRQVRTASSPVPCTPLQAPVERRLLAGESFDFAQGTVEVVLVHDGVASEPVRYVARTPSRMEARAGPLDLQIRPGRDGPALCP